MSRIPPPVLDAERERRHMNGWLGEGRGRRLLSIGELAGVEESLGAGRWREARARAEQAAVAAPASPWPRVWRAAASFRGGDAQAAQADARALDEGWPELSCGPALLAVLAAARGERVAAEQGLASAAARAPSAWLSGLRGLLRARWGLLQEARVDLEEAARGEPSAWILMARADVLNRLGLFVPALRDLERARRLLPSSAEPDLRAAAIHLDQAQYAEARRRLSRAIEAFPKDPEALSARARAAAVEGDLTSARRDAVRASRLAPRERRFLEAKIRLDLLLGKDAEARRSLRALPEAAREHWRGYRLCRLGRYAESRRRFERAARLDPGHPLSAFYAQVARCLGEAPPRRRAPGRSLTIMGLGYRQPFQVSREALFALRDCELLFSNLSDAAVADFLGLFPARFHAIVFRRRDQQSTRCARDVMPAFARRKHVGVVTRGHPLYYGRLAYRLVMDCRRRGIAVRVPPSVSIGDTILGMVERPGGAALGVQVRDSSRPDAADRRLPLVLYNLSLSGERRAQLARTLAVAYPAGHECVVLPGSGDGEFAPSRVALDALGPALDRADEAATVLVPGVS